MKSAYYFCSLLVCLVLEGQAVHAQTGSPTRVKSALTSGRWQMGLKDGYGQGDLLKHYNSLQAHAGYYVIDKLLIGIGAGWSNMWSGSIAFHDLTGGPLIRYQLMRARFSPFLEASYQFGQRRANPEWQASYPSASVQKAFISPGLSIAVMPSLRVDISYGFQRLINGYTDPNGYPQLGVNYLVGGK